MAYTPGRALTQTVIQIYCGTCGYWRCQTDDEELNRAEEILCPKCAYVCRPEKLGKALLFQPWEWHNVEFGMRLVKRSEEASKEIKKEFPCGHERLAHGGQPFSTIPERY